MILGSCPGVGEGATPTALFLLFFAPAANLASTTNIVWRLPAVPLLPRLGPLHTLMNAVLRAADYAMDTPDAAPSTSIAPLQGRLVPLRTRDEVRASLETLSAYVVEIPARYANAVKE